MNDKIAEDMVMRYLVYRLNTDIGNILSISTPKILKFFGITPNNKYYAKYAIWVNRVLRNMFPEFFKITKTNRYYFYIPKNIAEFRLKLFGYSV